MSRQRVRGALVLVVAVAISIGVSSGTASDFGVNPTTVLLSAAQSSKLLTLRNRSTGAIRFQARAYAWEQMPDGQMALAQTNDLVVFPPLVAVAAGEERRLRIGTLARAGALERNYRIIIEELPPHVAPGEDPPPGLTVLTRLSIPVFVLPTAPKAQATLRDLRLRDGEVAFSVENTGNVHFMVSTVTVKALDQAGQTLMSAPIQGWYVLAAGRRDFSVPVPAAACPQTASLLVEARVNTQSLVDRLQVAQPSCGLTRP